MARSSISSWRTAEWWKALRARSYVRSFQLFNTSKAKTSSTGTSRWKTCFWMAIWMWKSSISASPACSSKVRTASLLEVITWPSVSSTGNKRDTYCGSPPYATPKLFQDKNYDGTEVDGECWTKFWMFCSIFCFSLVSKRNSIHTGDQHAAVRWKTVEELRGRVLRGKYQIPFHCEFPR